MGLGLPEVREVFGSCLADEGAPGIPRPRGVEEVAGGWPLWLSGLDSNQDKLLQRELCYLYTTGQREGRSIALVGDGSRAGGKKNRRTVRGREVF